MHPQGAKVPSWIRKVLLRGLRVKPDERFPSMHDLLAALTRDPNVTRRKVVASAAGVVLMLAMAIGGRGILGNQTAVCAGGPEKLVGILGPAGAGRRGTAASCARP